MEAVSGSCCCCGIDWLPGLRLWGPMLLPAHDGFSTQLRACVTPAWPQHVTHSVTPAHGMSLRDTVSGVASRVCGRQGPMPPYCVNNLKCGFMLAVEAGQLSCGCLMESCTCGILLLAFGAPCSRCCCQCTAPPKARVGPCGARCPTRPALLHFHAHRLWAVCASGSCHWGKLRVRRWHAPFACEPVAVLALRS